MIDAVDFEVFLQGANQERVQHKRLKEGDKHLPPKEIKKWKSPSPKVAGQQTHPTYDSEQEQDEIEEDDTAQIQQEIESLDKNDFQLLRKSLCQPILSQEQKDLFKRLQEQPSNEKYNLHFSRMILDEEELQEVEEEPVNNLEQTNVTESEDVKKPEPAPSNRKSIQVQKVAVKVPEPKNRPISAVVEEVKKIPSKKQLNTNPFANRPKSVLQEIQISSPLPVKPINKSLQQLLSRIERMDEKQREQLEKMLDQLENPNSQPLELKLAEPKPAESKPAEPKPAEEFKLSITPKQVSRDNDNVITFIILNTWGSSSMVGLTEIQFFDAENQQIKLSPYQLRLRNTQSIKPIDIIISNQFKTNNAQYMWLASLPDASQRIEIEVSLPKDTVLGGIKVWNYNKSLIDSGKGVKDMMIRYNDTLELKVEIKKGTGNDLEDYGTEIPIKQGFDFVAAVKSTPKAEVVMRPSEVPQLNLMESNESQRLGSRRQRGPMVYNIFKEEDQVRVPTAKTGKNIDQVQQEVDPWKKPEGRQRFSDRQPTENDDLFKTLKQFDLSHPGRFQDKEKVNVPIRQPSAKIKDTEYDALDMFFRDQRKPQQVVQRQPWEQSAPQYSSLQEGKRVKQTDLNNQLIQRIISENQAQIQKQQSKPVNNLPLPTLPMGRNITIKILSTWGDRHYVGLNGIEFFDEKGTIIEILHPKRQVKADPADINTLPEYDGDPRTPDKLVDGVYFTQSDLHVWLAPYQRGKVNYIYLDLLEKKSLSMIRIWNYNKSRIHSFRGVKEIVIDIDNKTVFQGVISKAPGNLSFHEAQNERIFELLVFTEDQGILQHISKTDWINNKYNDSSQKVLQESILPRPTTGSNLEMEQRPTTSVKVSQLKNEIKQARQLQLQENLQPQLKPIQKGSGVQCTWLKIELYQSWQKFDATYIGLTGIKLYDENSNPIAITQSQLTAQPKDMTTIAGHSGDQRVLANLINDVNISKKDQNMWMVPFNQGKTNFIQFTFSKPQLITGIKFWNYNKSQEDSYRGVKVIGLFNQNGAIGTSNLSHLYSLEYILKKAPGVDTYDFGQFVPLPLPSIFETVEIPKPAPKGVPHDYETLTIPQGFDLRISLLETHGDIHYIGLNGIDLYDPSGTSIIKSNTCYISASPQSMQNDPRVIQNLLKEPYQTYEDQYMWLSPFVNRYFDDPAETFNERINTVYLTFDKPINLAAISFWNYTKQPERGVKEVAIWLDENLIFKGYLRIAQAQSKYQENENMNQTVILFCKIPALMEKFAGKYYNELDKQQKVAYQNENKGEQYVHKNFGSLDRPPTSVQGKPK